MADILINFDNNFVSSFFPFKIPSIIFLQDRAFNETLQLAMSHSPTDTQQVVLVFSKTQKNCELKFLLNEGRQENVANIVPQVAFEREFALAVEDKVFR